MANEVQVRLSVNVRDNDGNLDWPSRPTAWSDDMVGRKGPTPGAITVSSADAGTDVNFSELVEPGICFLYNVSSDFDVDYGPYDPDTDRWYPFWRLKPGKGAYMPFGPRFGQEVLTPGTGSHSGMTLRMRAVGGDAVVQVNAFEA